MLDGTTVLGTGTITVVPDGQTTWTFTPQGTNQAPLPIGVRSLTARLVDSSNNTGISSNLWQSAIDGARLSLSDNSGDGSDRTIRFSTQVPYLSNGEDKPLVRPNFADQSKKVTLTNSGTRPLDISGITSANPDVSLLNPQQTAFSIAPGQSQDVLLRYKPSSADQSFDLITGLTINSNAINSPSTSIRLKGTSTFNADVDYNGSVYYSDFTILNSFWGSNSASNNWFGAADINGDGFISYGDLTGLNAEWSRSLSVLPS